MLSSSIWWMVGYGKDAGFVCQRSNGYGGLAIPSLPPFLSTYTCVSPALQGCWLTSYSHFLSAVSEYLICAHGYLRLCLPSVGCSVCPWVAFISPRFIRYCPDAPDRYPLVMIWTVCSMLVGVCALSMISTCITRLLTASTALLLSSSSVLLSSL